MKKILPFLLFISSSAFALGPWLQKNSMGGLGRHLACSMTIGQHGYVGGGWDGVTVYTDFWEYDPATNAWTQEADCPQMLWSNPCFGIDTVGFACCANNTWMYRPNGNVWTNVNNAAPAGTYMEEVRYVINGKGYTIDQDYMYEFDPITYQWTIKYTFPTSNFACDAGFTIGNKAYLIDNYYHKFYEYDPAANTLTQKTTCPLPNTYGASFGVNGKGYTGLGFVITQSGSIQDYVEYDPITDSWRGINTFSGANRRKATSFVIGNFAYVTCGSGGINLNDLWEFDNSKVTGINDPENNFSISVYPNPSSGIFKLAAGSGQLAKNKKEMKIFNVNGELILQNEISDSQTDGSSSLTIDLSTQPKGIYFLKISSPTGSSTKKLVLI